MSMATTRPSRPTTFPASRCRSRSPRQPRGTGAPLPARAAGRTADSCAGRRWWPARPGEAGDLFVCVVPVARRDKVLARHGEHRPAEPLGAKKPPPPELPDLRLPLLPEALVALDGSARRRNDPPAHRSAQAPAKRPPAREPQPRGALQKAHEPAGDPCRNPTCARSRPDAGDDIPDGRGPARPPIPTYEGLGPRTMLRLSVRAASPSARTVARTRWARTAGPRGMRPGGTSVVVGAGRRRGSGR
jgi:hypothetical protein